MLKKMNIRMVSCWFAVLVLLLVWAGGAQAQRMIPYLGSGSYEVTIYSDYFCPPCKIIDAKVEPLLIELLATGKVKIIFIDVPFHRPSPLYAKYYLYAANANNQPNNILHVRKKLFEAAQVKKIIKEDALLAYLREEKIAFAPLDEKSVFPLLSSLIKENEIRQTPTCVIRYSATDVKKFIGTDEIWNGLNALKALVVKEKI